MVAAKDFARLTHVGIGTPMGDLLRRYWMPALLAEEVAEADGDPKVVRLLGEDLVAFRDTQGRLAVMDLQCPHRLASLALGRNEEGGLRCLYHGWKIDVDGKILETPCEPPTSRLKDAVTHRSYPVREAAGLVWVYLGPPEKMPPLPDFNWMTVAPEFRSIVKMWEDCNFLQSIEGILDSFHTNLLHSGYEVLHWEAEQIAQFWRRPSRAAYGTIRAENTSYGYHYAAVREPTEDAERRDYVRITEFVFPFFCMNPPDLGATSRPFMFVPIDDENTMLYEVRATEEGVEQASRRGTAPGTPIDHQLHLEQSSMRLGEDLYPDYRPKRNRANNYHQDRELMRQRVDPAAFSGIAGGAQMQDLAMIETMGRVSDRSREHLGVSDIAIVHFRDLLAHVVAAFEGGAEPPGIDPPVPYRDIRAVGAFIEKGADWTSATWQNSMRTAEAAVSRSS